MFRAKILPAADLADARFARVNSRDWRRPSAAAWRTLVFLAGGAPSSAARRPGGRSRA